jgi:hypothetical protein
LPSSLPYPHIIYIDEGHLLESLLFVKQLVERAGADFEHTGGLYLPLIELLYEFVADFYADDDVHSYCVARETKNVG